MRGRADNGYIRRPGTKGGPCADPNCGHKSCEEMRAMAEGKCPWCGEKIGYERRFVRQPDGSCYHLACVHESVQQR